MIVVVEKYNEDRYRHLLNQMFRLRARVFRDRLGWNVNVVDGMERDPYDDMDPAYVLYTDEAASVVKGSLRLLPTTGPTLIRDAFSDTLPDAALLSAPSIWECTRFCFDADMLRTGNREEALLASGILLEGLGSVALRSGITSILGNFAPSMLRVYRRFGCAVDVLGTTRRYGKPVYLGAFPVSEEHLANIRRQIAALRVALTPIPEDLAA
jgi:N-acyl-L-homoserine lactone synthetase